MYFKSQTLVFTSPNKLRALSPFVPKQKMVLSDEMLNGTVQPGEHFLEQKECLQRYSSLFLSTEMTGISRTISKTLTCAIILPTFDDFVNLGTSHPSLLSSTGSFLTNGTASYFDPFLPEEINCSICPKNPTRKFHANGKRSRIL